jgi:hypothetical protein
MKVRELIEHLKQFDPELEVYGNIIPPSANGPGHVEQLPGFKVLKVYFDNHGPVTEVITTRYLDGTKTNNRDTERNILAIKPWYE